MDAHIAIKRTSYLLILVFIFAGYKAINIYEKAFTANVSLSGSGQDYILVPTDSRYADVIKIISDKKFIVNKESFDWTARKKNYPNHIKAGRYKIKDRMSNNELINVLRSGKQEPVELTFNNIRTLSQLTERVSQELEVNQTKLLDLLSSPEILAKYGLNDKTIICIFIPNTYEFFWNTSEVKFIDRMFREYNKFWNRDRIGKAGELHMTKEQVITLASIVDEETDKDVEKPKIAGVYINRLNKKIRLQADPTVVFCVGDFTLQRVLRKHYQIDSPYNTYIYGGLPPGPICIPEIASIDAVLNYEKHNYLYFCAKPDFSGYHTFARTLEAHNNNARIYRSELNKRKIYH
jgi:UPF0755 protein